MRWYHIIFIHFYKKRNNGKEHKIKNSKNSVGHTFEGKKKKEVVALGLGFFCCLADCIR